MMVKDDKNIVVSLAVVAVLMAVAALLQVFVGDVPTTIFRFPLNLIIAGLWLYLVIESYRSRQRSRVAQYLLSPAASWLSVLMVIVACVVMGLQRQPAILSFPFAMAMLYVLTQLAMVILRGWRNSIGIRWRFLCNHVGLWLAIFAAFWGAPDSDVLRTVVVAERPTDEAYYIDGRMTLLGYEMQLTDFRAEYYDNGTPSSYEADVLIDGRNVTLSVNHPYARNWYEDIYLTSYEPRNNGVSCVVQVVRHPWKWPMATGILMLIVGAVMMFIQGPKKQRV